MAAHFKVGQALTLHVEKPAVGGPMIGRVDGQVVLVSGAIPGETVTTRVTRVAKGVIHASTQHVDEASPDRRATSGDPLCGGCVYSHIAYPRQLTIKSQVIADAFQRIGRIELQAPAPVAASPEDGYRMRARLHVRGHRMGFFREGTHDLCDAGTTRQLLPSTHEALARLAAAMASLGVTNIREVDLSENLDASERVMSFDAPNGVDVRLVEALSRIEGFTPAPYVTDTLTIGASSISLRRHVLAFFQGNRHLLKALVGHVAARVPIGSGVLDLYAGVGLFAIAALSLRGAGVAAVEGDRYAAEDLQANGTAAGGQMHAIRSDVESFLGGAVALLKRMGLPIAETIIVDPPRTGLSPAALDGVLSMAPRRLIYVSCDVATLARDARRIVEQYAISRIDAFDLFPNTPHVETVAVFERV